LRSEKGKRQENPFDENGSITGLPVPLNKEPTDRADNCLTPPPHTLSCPRLRRPGSAFEAKPPVMAYRLAYSTNAYTRFQLPEAIRRIARLGFDGLEILADAPHLLPDWTAKDHASVTGALR
jgi:hypothetical protein